MKWFSSTRAEWAVQVGQVIITFISYESQSNQYRAAGRPTFYCSHIYHIPHVVQSYSLV